MGAVALWVRLLPAYTGDDNKNLARSLRRRFALVGLLFASALVATVWDWTANIAITAGAAVMHLRGSRALCGVPNGLANSGRRSAAPEGYQVLGDWSFNCPRPD
jgi:hypothetical protein